MIVVLAKVSVKAEKKKELLEMAKVVMAATRKEEGCASYTLYDHPHDPCGCMFVEEWADKAALAKHAASAHIAEWKKNTADFLTTKTVLTVYQAEKITP